MSNILISVVPIPAVFLQDSTDEDLVKRFGWKMGYALDGLTVERYGNFRNQRGVTVLMGRTKKGERIDLFLLPRKNHTVCLLLNQGRNPVRRTYLRFVEMLESFQQNNTAEYASDPDGRSAFMQAVCSADFDGAEVYLKNGANVDETTFGQYSALHFAVMDGMPDVVKFLLDHGANVNCQDHLKMTPLHIAARDGETKILAELLSRNPDLNLQDFRQLPALYYAVYEGHADCVKLLVKAGADIKFTTDPVFKTPLIMTAVVQNDPEVLKALISGGLDLQVKNSLGENALLRVLNLYVSGRDPRKLKLAEVLINAGIDVNCRDEKGVTALMYAAVAGNEPLIRLLLKHGADKTLKDGQGRSASAYLDRSKYPGLAKYF